MKPNVIVICGPTASGKTALAVELARQLGGEVVSADSMQVYRRMDIGTAKPTLQEMGGIPHHMIDVADPEENYSVARYVAQAIPIMDSLLAQGKLPIIAGGTGLYIDHLIAGRQFAPFSPDSDLRQSLQKRAREEGLPALRTQLWKTDPESASRIHPNDEKRTIRALEVYLSTGKTITQHHRESRTIPSRYTPLTIALTFRERPRLWERIDQRVDRMMEQGLEAEVRRLLADGVPPDCTAMQAIGYKELARAIVGNSSIAQAAQEVKLRSRQYAKRQLTWFRRNPNANWFYLDEPSNISSALVFSTNLAMGCGLQ